ncbi:DUF4386 domain-containing protein [Thermomonas carbonis]|uniref:DUF4386 domain-containing protein n=1 Tax=Thermomonas carbonis TaxID=1463158 RepID=A0A7G9SP99_9GAMM|nr:DUF4386 domain-containing protein [Thermomonas carbonis]QNN69674.1 DUF4386 domain-containing protein [Thermomonas carbonis]GHB94715.1 hypothetical protein GCM10010080_02460 [Thermomonas carbonis]
MNAGAGDSGGLKGQARFAGLLYLIVVATGIFSLGYVPSQINAAQDWPATMGNIVAHESLFRWGIAAFLIKQVAFLLLPLLLYRVLGDADRIAAIAMVAFAVISVPLALVALGHKLDALSLLTDPVLANTIAPAQLQAMAVQALDAYGNALVATRLFWGLWLLPFGWLVLKSERMPKALGIMLVLGCLGYLVDVFGGLLAPAYADSMIASVAMLPASIGEIGACFWLLLFGARKPRDA